MLRAEPLFRVQLLMLASEAQDAALALARFGVFNPAPCRADALPESPAAAYREAWLEAGARLCGRDCATRLCRRDVRCLAWGQ